MIDLPTIIFRICEDKLSMRGRRLCINAINTISGRRHVSLAKLERIYRHIYDFADDAGTDRNKCGDICGHENSGNGRGDMCDARICDAEHFFMHRVGENNF